MNAWLKRCVFNLDLNMDDVLYLRHVCGCQVSAINTQHPVGDAIAGIMSEAAQSRDLDISRLRRSVSIGSR